MVQMLLRSTTYPRQNSGSSIEHLRCFCTTSSAVMRPVSRSRST